MALLVANRNSTFDQSGPAPLARGDGQTYRLSLRTPTFDQSQLVNLPSSPNGAAHPGKETLQLQAVCRSHMAFQTDTAQNLL